MFIGARTSANRRRNNVIEGSKSWSVTPFTSVSPFSYTRDLTKLRRSKMTMMK